MPSLFVRLMLLALAALPASARAHGAFHERMAQLAARLERTPRDARAHFELAELFARHGDWALALGSADSADEFQPGAFPTDLVRAEAHLALGRPAAARTALDRFLPRHPAHARTLVLRARAHAALDEPAAALADYRASLKIPPAAAPDPDHVREAVEALAAAGHRDEALAALARILTTPAPDPALLQLALELETAAGRTDAALTRVAALEAAAPRREPWMARRARVLAAGGRTVEAHSAWRELLHHLDSLPNLDRGSPALRSLAAEAHAALAALPHPPATP